MISKSAPIGADKTCTFAVKHALFFLNISVPKMQNYAEIIEKRALFGCWIFFFLGGGHMPPPPPGSAALAQSPCRGVDGAESPVFQGQ